MKKTLFAVLVCTLMTLTLTGCGSKVETDNRVGNVSIEKLNDINNKIIYYLMIMAHPYITITVITM